MKKIVFTTHARQRAEERGLTDYLRPHCVRKASPTLRSDENGQEFRYGRCIFLVKKTNAQRIVKTLYPVSLASK
jgi:hypothetical protein